MRDYSTCYTCSDAVKNQSICALFKWPFLWSSRKQYFQIFTSVGSILTVTHWGGLSLYPQDSADEHKSVPETDYILHMLRHITICETDGKRALKTYIILYEEHLCRLALGNAIDTSNISMAGYATIKVLPIVCTFCLVLLCITLTCLHTWQNGYWFSVTYIIVHLTPHSSLCTTSFPHAVRGQRCVCVRVSWTI